MAAEGTFTRDSSLQDSEDYKEKYRKYESIYVRRLMSKYFSGKDIYGENIFAEKVTIDDEDILSSRWPGTQSFADPVQSFEEKRISDSTCSSDILASLSNEKHMLELKDCKEETISPGLAFS